MSRRIVGLVALTLVVLASVALAQGKQMPDAGQEHIGVTGAFHVIRSARACLRVDAACRGEVDEESAWAMRSGLLGRR